MRIGIDVDGVLMDFVSAFRDTAQRLFGKEFPSFSSDWDFSNWGLSKAEYGRLWERVKQSENWFLFNERPFGFSIESLSLLKRHELYFVTTRSQTVGEPILLQTQKQLHMLGVQFPTVLVRADKGRVASGLQLDIFVDDYVENLKMIEEQSPITKLFLVNQTYNEYLPVPSNWTRVKNLKDFAERIDRGEFTN